MVQPTDPKKAAWCRLDQFIAIRAAKQRIQLRDRANKAGGGQIKFLTRRRQSSWRSSLRRRLALLWRGTRDTRAPKEPRTHRQAPCTRRRGSIASTASRSHPEGRPKRRPQSRPRTPRCCSTLYVRTGRARQLEARVIPLHRVERHTGCLGTIE